MLTEFRFRPDAVEVIKHSHPYGLAKLDSDPNHLYVNDAGLTCAPNRCDDRTQTDAGPVPAGTESGFDAASGRGFGSRQYRPWPNGTSSW